MIDEPERTLDDTNPNRPVTLDDRLRAEEPPLQADDTSPRRPLEAQLRAEEPPFSVHDTSPTGAVPESLLSDEWPPRPSRRTEGASWVQRAVAGAMLLSAILLTAAAVVIWLAGGDDEGGAPADNVAVIAPTATSEPAPASTLIPEQPADNLPDNPPDQAAPVPAVAMMAPLPILPTAAADEIAAALLTPVPAAPKLVAIPRESAPFTIRRTSSRTAVELYTVQDGDTLDSIAAQFGLKDLYTLIWSNKSSKYNPLRTGAQLNILPVDGVYHEVTETLTIGQVAEMYGVDPYTIIDSEYNDALFGSTPETLLPVGLWIIVPGGEAERELFLPGNPNAGSAGSGNYITGTYTLWGCTADVEGGSPPYSRPLASYRWVRGFSPGGHTGVDLSARHGDSIFAAGSGTVVYAGWSDGGYGNVVVVAHGGSFSIYGHMSSINTRCGQQVSAGQVVGYVGSTGNSSGDHLHFEVRDPDWNALNPQNWVGF